MKVTSLISGKAHHSGQGLTRGPRARAALVTGLAMVALLGGAGAAAQASTTSPAAAHIVTPRAFATLKLGTAATPAVTCSGSAIVDEHNGSPLYSFIPGGGNVNLYFDSSGAATSFCPVDVVNSTFGGWQFYVNGTSVCLALDASTASIHEGSAKACADLANYTLWSLKPTSNSSYFLYDSAYNGDCIYDNTQRPATYAGCSASNQFEWLSFP